MVSVSVITVMLTLGVVMGIFPVIAGIALLVSRKIKGSAFWMGVLMTIVSSILISVVQVIAIGGDTSAAINGSIGKGTLTALQLISTFVNTALVLLCFKVFIKRSSDLKGAVSFGLGFGGVSLISYGISMFSNYALALMINNGTFEQTYKQAMDMGAVDEETVRTLKKTVVDLTPASLLINLPNCIAVTLMIIASAMFIVRGINKRNMLPNLLIAFGVNIAVGLIAGLVANVYIAVGLISAAALAAFIYAMAVRSDLKKPEPVRTEDSFLASVKAVKEESPAGGEYNPYE